MRTILSYLRYLVQSVNQHGVHSPFVYYLYLDVIRDEKSYYVYQQAESLRAKMLLSETTIDALDFGTGKTHYPKRRSISFIARRFSTPSRFGKLLFRLVNHFHPEFILEMGTSLGITTSYLASANSHSKVFTLEGCPETASVAKSNFQLLNLENVNLEVGEFESALPKALSRMPRIDFAYIDGNHRLEPTLRYTELCLEKMNANSILVIDDIHWSTEMEEAWRHLKNDKRVSVSLDLFQMGILFFHEGQTKQDFVLKF